MRRLAHLVQPRERQQVLDQHAHARGLVLDPPHRLRDVLRLARRAHAEQLRVAADRDQRRAQLVRGVGDEAPQPLLARLARGERVLEPVEHAVQREPEAADLGALVGRLDAVREVAAGDRGGGVAHAVQREQADAHDDQREAADQHQHDDDHDALDQQQPLERLVGGRHRDRGDGDRAVARGRGEHAVVADRGLDGLAARRPRCPPAAPASRRSRSGSGSPSSSTVAGAVALLAVGVRRRAAAGRQAAAARAVLERRPGVVELALEPEGRALELRVDAVERNERCVA